MKMKIAAAIAAVTILAGFTSVPAFANVDPAQTEEYVESTDTAETDSTREAGPGEQIIDRSGQTEETAGQEENHDPLTPAGNMTLVDNITSSSGSKQFLTLTSRDGNFYYLIIDYDKDGNENVHFLNQVDERDLIGLMDEDDAKELEEQLAQKAAEEEAAKAALQTPATPEPEPEPTPAPEAEKTFVIAGYEFSQKTVVAVIGLTIFALICLAGFIILSKKKKNETKKPDPDADYEDDYGDELDIPEDDLDDDFDE